MNRIEKFFLRRFLKYLVTQGPKHEENTTDVFIEIRRAWYNEFTEDNMNTQNFHLLELFEQSGKHFNIIKDL